MRKIRRIKPIKIKTVKAKRDLTSYIPQLLRLRYWWLKASKHVTEYSPLFFAVIFAVGSVLVWIDLYTKVPPMPDEAMARQSNLLNMTALLLVAYAYSVLLRVYKTPIPRGNKAFKF